MPDPPVETPSEATEERQIELARAEGAAYLRSVRHVVADVADVGGMTEQGDYVVAFVQQAAAGTYQRRDGDLSFVEPTAENCHLQVAVADAIDGRFVPHLSVAARLHGDDGESVGPVDLPFCWHPGTSHYGANLTLPGDGTYDVHVRIDPAAFDRHDERNGTRFDDAVEVVFEDVQLSCGQS